MGNKQTIDVFSEEALRLRAEYEHRRVTTNLYPPCSPALIEIDLKLGSKSNMTYWFEDSTEMGQCVRIWDVSGTLSGDILRLNRNLPPNPGHFEIDSNDIRQLGHC